MLVFLLAIAEESAKSKIEYLYETYHDDMLRFARSRLKAMNSETAYCDAEDIVQEAFIKITIFHDRIDLSWETKRIRAYLFAMIGNLIYDMQRTKKDHEDIEDYRNTLQSEDDFVDALMVRERAAEVEKALEDLHEIYRMTLLYRFYENRSIDDIARFMGVSENVVSVRIYRAQRILKEALEGGKEHD